MAKKYILKQYAKCWFGRQKLIQETTFDTYEEARAEQVHFYRRDFYIGIYPHFQYDIVVEEHYDTVK